MMVVEVRAWPQILMIARGLGKSRAIAYDVGGSSTSWIYARTQLVVVVTPLSVHSTRYRIDETGDHNTQRSARTTQQADSHLNLAVAHRQLGLIFTHPASRATVDGPSIPPLSKLPPERPAQAS